MSIGLQKSHMFYGQAAAAIAARGGRGEASERQEVVVCSDRRPVPHGRVDFVYCGCCRWRSGEGGLASQQNRLISGSQSNQYYRSVSQIAPVDCKSTCV